MLWKNFYAAWQERIGVNMPAEALPAWGAYVSGVPDDIALQALELITELYFAQRRRDGTYTPPTLWQFRKAVQEIFTGSRPQQENHCRLCDGEGVVMILDRVGGREFPPDPADADLPRRCLCAIDCPDCRKESYLKEEFRQRVRARCRSNRRRGELLEKV